MAPGACDETFHITHPERTHKDSILPQTETIREWLLVLLQKGFAYLPKSLVSDLVPEASL